MHGIVWCACDFLLQGLRCDHGLTVIGQRLRQVVEAGHLDPAVVGGGGGGRSGASALEAAALADEGGAAEAEVVTEAEWLDLERVSFKSV